MFQELMMEYANRTGLASDVVPPKRYLWTDAFAVCNFLGLHVDTGEERYRELALQLVDQVHHVLGRHRNDDSRSGWISGLDEQEAERHPTIGGLRIGKAMNERRQDESYDQNQEWDRDGQYFHYLTKWMHALNRVSRVTGDARYNRWAIELAQTAHAHFTYQPSADSQKRMYWKMSIDLSRPLVPSMGQQDPLDGHITYNQLQLCHPRGSEGTAEPGLQHQITEMAALCAGKSWATDDMLGIGGLSIGLQAVARLDKSLEPQAEYYASRRELQRQVEMLMAFRPLVKIIEDFWQHPGNRQIETWKDHLDINAVMLATSLSPDGFLTI